MTEVPSAKVEFAGTVAVIPEVAAVSAQLKIIAVPLLFVMLTWTACVEPNVTGFGSSCITFTLIPSCVDVYALTIDKLTSKTVNNVKNANAFFAML